MPKYRITSPDGKTYDVNAPEGASKEDALAYAQSHFEKTGLGERALKNLPKDLASIGAGTIEAVKHPINTANALLDVAEGGVQSIPGVGDFLLKHGLSEQDNRAKAAAFAEPFKQDFGSIEGFKEAIATHPATTFLNVSSIGGAVQGAAKRAAGDILKDALKNSAAAAAKANKLAAPKNAILSAGQEAGYVIAPSDVNPSFFNKRLESIAGKAAINQQAQAGNQAVTTALARQALGLPEDTVLSLPELESIKRTAGKAYADVGNLPAPPSLARGYSGPHRVSTPKQDLEALKQARNDSQGWYDAYKVSKSPDDLKKAQQFATEARMLEASLTHAARQAGKPELAISLAEARKQIAKTYDVQRALNRATGEVNAQDLGRLIDKDKPLTGPLKLAGEFQQAFPKFIREGEKVPTAGVSKSEAITALLLGGGGAATMGPYGAVAGALPLLSTPIRNILLSKPYQKAMARIPMQSPSRALSLSERLANNSDGARMAIINAIIQQQQGQDRN